MFRVSWEPVRPSPEQFPLGRQTHGQTNGTSSAPFTITSVMNSGPRGQVDSSGTPT